MLAIWSVPRSCNALNVFRRVLEMSVNSQLYLLMAAFLIGFGVAGAVVYSGLGKVQVNGPIYQRVVQGKDLVADILPPPEYLIESYLVVLEMLRAEPAALPALFEEHAVAPGLRYATPGLGQ